MGTGWEFGCNIFFQKIIIYVKKIQLTLKNIFCLKILTWVLHYDKVPVQVKAKKGENKRK